MANFGIRVLGTPGTICRESPNLKIDVPTRRQLQTTESLHIVPVAETTRVPKFAMLETSMWLSSLRTTRNK